MNHLIGGCVLAPRPDVVSYYLKSGRSSQEEPASGTLHELSGREQEDCVDALSRGSRLEFQVQEVGHAIVALCIFSFFRRLSTRHITFSPHMTPFSLSLLPTLL
jgi:hypothetical protein